LQGERPFRGRFCQFVERTLLLSSLELIQELYRYIQSSIIMPPVVKVNIDQNENVLFDETTQPVMGA